MCYVSQNDASQLNKLFMGIVRVVEHRRFVFFVDNPSDDISISFINIHRLLDACWLIYKREKLL